MRGERPVYDGLRNLAWGMGEYLPDLRRFLSRQWSYSQEGEDRLLLKYFDWRRDGFYVDVGAHHPHRYSNTQLFYELGWRGINIDAMPSSMKAFEKFRPRDINLEVGVGECNEAVRFFIFKDPAMNGFDEETARRHQANGWELAETRQIKVRLLKDLLRDHLPKGTEIDFLSIDVEGYELSVLRSNDWEFYRPKMIVTELIDRPLEAFMNDPCAIFLRSMGYRPFGKTFHSFFFART